MDMYGQHPLTDQNLGGDFNQQQAGSFQSHRTSELGFATTECTDMRSYEIMRLFSWTIIGESARLSLQTSGLVAQSHITHNEPAK